MEALLQDLRYAIRSLTHTPGFTAVVTLTLALGIGGTASVFSALNLAVISAPPFPKPEQLVALDVTVAWPGAPTESIGWSYPKFETMRAATTLLEDVTARLGQEVTIVGGAEPERVRAEMVSPAYFALLGIRPAIGRVLDHADDAEATAAVVVLSHSTWRADFGGDSSIVGRALRVNGVPMVVVGVAQPGFRGLGGDAGAWVPIRALTRLNNFNVLDERWAHQFTGFARLRPGVTLDQARAEMESIGRIVDRAHPMPGGGGARWGAVVAPFSAARDNPASRSILFVLAGAVGLLLLLACVNVANMLLVRALAREREIVIRSALGASRWRLVRQLLLESMVLTGAGGIAGMGLAVWGIQLLRTAVPGTVSSHGVQFLRAEALSLNLDSIAFTAAVVIAAGVVMGLAPAWHLWRADARLAIRAGASVSRGVGSLRRMRLRGGLVVAQVALAAVLLIGAGLMYRTLARLAAVQLGFTPDGVVAVRYGLPLANSTVTDPARFHASVLERFRAILGVTGVAMSGCAPLEGCSEVPTVSRIDGRPPYSEAETPTVRTHHVSDDYFRVLGIPLLRGRLFEAQDQASSPPVIVLSETAARRIFGTSAGIGRRIAPSIEPFSKHMGEVIGIVADVKQVHVQEDPQADVYVSLRQAPYNELTVFFKTSANHLAILPAARAAMRELASDVPLYAAKPLPQFVHEATARERLILISLLAFAGLGLVLAAIGVYGVLAFSVAQRTHEVGVRMALGARTVDILRHVVGQGVVLVAVGVGIGGVLALALTRALRGVLFGVAPDDPVTLAAVAVLLMGVACVASFVPARRAMRVDPVVTLRAD